MTHCAHYIDVPAYHASYGAAQAEISSYQQGTLVSLIIDVQANSNGVESMLRPGTHRFTVRVPQSTNVEYVWQPRTERGRRLMALRERIVADGTRLLDLDEINQELVGGRRQNV